MEEAPKHHKKKNNLPLILGVVGIVVLLIIFAVAYLFIIKKSASQTANTPSTDQTQQVMTVKPEDIGLSLTPRSDNKAIILNITKLSNIKSVDYSVDYDANVVDPDSGTAADVPRGVEGAIDVKPTDTEIKREIELGTCSRNVCTYDKVVSGIKVTLKLTYGDGKIGAVVQTVNINQ